MDGSEYGTKYSYARSSGGRRGVIKYRLPIQRQDYRGISVQLSVTEPEASSDAQ